jgi:HlyD family type I secretion membrane fusion protein
MEDPKLSANTEFIIPLDGNEFIPPISRWTTLGGIFLLATIGITAILAAITPFPNIVRSSASVRPDGDVKIAQSAVEGSVKKLLVKENQEVSKGQPIAFIDDSRLQTRKSQLEGSIQQGTLQIQQLDAQTLNLNNQITAEENLMNRTVVSGQSDLNRIEREYADKRDIAFREVQEAEANMLAAKAEFLAFENASKEGGVPKIQVETKRQAYLATQARLQRAKTSLDPTSATISVAEEQIAQSQSKGQSTLANLQKEKESLQQQRSQVKNQVEKDHKEIKQVINELKDVVIRSQVDGTILKMILRNEGQVVRSGEVIAQISPKNTPLSIKARVRPQDIGEVRVGQRVNMRVSAYIYTDYGTLNGKVVSVGTDAITAQSEPQEGSNANKSEPTSTYFEVIIQPDKTYLIKNNRQYEISSGMEVQADIISREETILTFILRKARLFVGV